MKRDRKNISQVATTQSGPTSPPPDHPSGERRKDWGGSWLVGSRQGRKARGRRAERIPGRRTPAPRYFSPSVHRTQPASPAHVEKRCHGGGRPDNKKRRGLCLSPPPLGFGSTGGPPLSPARLRPLPSLRTEEPRHARGGAASRTVGLSNPAPPRPLSSTDHTSVSS